MLQIHVPGYLTYRKSLRIFTTPVTFAVDRRTLVLRMQVVFTRWSIRTTRHVTSHGKILLIKSRQNLFWLDKINTETNGLHYSNKNMFLNEMNNVECNIFPCYFNKNHGNLKLYTAPFLSRITSERRYPAVAQIVNFK